MGWNNRSVIALLLPILLAGCGGSSLEVALVLPSDTPRSELSFLRMSAVGPTGLRATPDGGTERFLLRCRDLSGFGRDSLAQNAEHLTALGVDMLSSPRQGAYPGQDGMSLTLDPPSVNTLRNPWGAMLVRVEVGGPAPKSGAVQDDVPAESPWLQGCFCFRTEDEASVSDATLDEAVKGTCPPLSAFEAAPLDLILEPLASAAFELRSEGPTSQVVTSGSVRRIEPGVVIEPKRCLTSASSPDCITCEGSCPEIEDLSNLAVRAQIMEGGAGEISTTSLVYLTDKAGLVRPPVEVKRCVNNALLRLSVLGRPSVHTDFELRCVPRLDLGSPILLPAFQAESEVFLAHLPADPARGGPGALAMASTVLEGARIELFREEGSRLIVTTSTIFPGERPHGLLGFAISASTPWRGVLSAVTSVGSEPTPRVRLIEVPSNPAFPLHEAARLDGMCPGCACTGEACAPCAALADGFGRAEQRASLMDADEFMDLSFLFEGSSTLTTIYSNDLVLPAPSEPLRLPPLSQSCLGQEIIRPVNGFEILELGGIETGPRGPADIITAEVQGLFLRYDPGPAASVDTCNLPNFDCPAGPRCPSACAPAVPLVGLTMMSDVRRIRLREGKDESDLVSVGFEQSTPLLLFTYGRARPLGPLLPREEMRHQLLRIDRREGSIGGARNRRISVGDLNGDGRDDFVLWERGADGLQVWLGGADVPLELGEDAVLSASMSSCLVADVVLGDVRENDRDELVVACTNGTVLVF